DDGPPCATHSERHAACCGMVSNFDRRRNALKMELLRSAFASRARLSLHCLTSVVPVLTVYQDGETQGQRETPATHRLEPSVAITRHFFRNYLPTRFERFFRSAETRRKRPAQQPFQEKAAGEAQHAIRRVKRVVVTVVSLPEAAQPLILQLANHGIGRAVIGGREG